VNYRQPEDPSLPIHVIFAPGTTEREAEQMVAHVDANHGHMGGSIRLVKFDPTTAEAAVAIPVSVEAPEYHDLLIAFRRQTPRVEVACSLTPQARPSHVQQG
jgi:hypothetical protein